jgi:hypothetical protein
MAGKKKAKKAQKASRSKATKKKGAGKAPKGVKRPPKAGKKSPKKSAKKAPKKATKKAPKKTAKKASAKPAKKSSAKKSAKKSANKPTKRSKGKASKPARKPTTGKSSSVPNKPKLIPRKPLPAPAKKKQTVAAGPGQPAKSSPGTFDNEPADVDDYETMRQAAVEPFKRTGEAPKPSTAGRLFDDEEELEDYDPLFDEVGEEDDE